MNSNRLKNRLIQATLMIMVAMVLVAASGISYTIHYCSNTRTDIRLFPEINNGKAVCGCEHVNPGQASIPPDGTLISRTHCCKNIHYYHKIQVLTTEKFQLERFTAVFSGLNLEEPVLFFREKTADDTDYKVPGEQPSDLAGKALILALHQFRIPSPTGDCC